MKRIVTLSTIALSLGLASVSLAAQKKLSRDQMVHKDKSDVQRIDEWIYNDLEQARAEARRTGKPLMVVFRCIP
jgi:serine protease Do